MIRARRVLLRVFLIAFVLLFLIPVPQVFSGDAPVKVRISDRWGEELGKWGLKNLSESFLKGLLGGVGFPYWDISDVIWRELYCLFDTGASPWTGVNIILRTPCNEYRYDLGRLRAMLGKRAFEALTGRGKSRSGENGRRTDDTGASGGKYTKRYTWESPPLPDSAVGTGDACRDAQGVQYYEASNVLSTEEEAKKQAEYAELTSHPPVDAVIGTGLGVAEVTYHPEVDRTTLAFLETAVLPRHEVPVGGKVHECVPANIGSDFIILQQRELAYHSYYSGKLRRVANYRKHIAVLFSSVGKSIEPLMTALDDPDTVDKRTAMW